MLFLNDKINLFKQPFPCNYWYISFQCFSLSSKHFVTLLMCIFKGTGLTKDYNFGTTWENVIFLFS